MLGRPVTCYTSKCKRDRERASVYYVANRSSFRKYNLKHLYGISIEQYDEMYQRQGGRCAVCGTHQSLLKRRLYVDHDHKTGKVRGLLCYNCNSAIGKLGDSLEGLQRAIDYMKTAETE